MYGRGKYEKPFSQLGANRGVLFKKKGNAHLQKNAQKGNAIVFLILICTLPQYEDLKWVEDSLMSIRGTTAEGDGVNG